MRMSNSHNRIVYSLWSPIYDALLERFFAPGRRSAMEAICLGAGERACIVGVGTGTDLLYLPPGVDAVGIDLSEDMLTRARRKLPVPGCTIQLQIGDAMALPLADGAFDAGVLNLILSVVPDPVRCISETLRVVRPGGRLVVFDKFLADTARLTLFRRLMNVFATLLGTDINRRLGDILARQPCTVVSDRPSLLGGMYRVVLLTRR